MISPDQAYHYKIVPFAVEEDLWQFWTTDPDRKALQKELQVVFGKKVALFHISKEALYKYLGANYRRKESSTQRPLTASKDFLEQVIAEAKTLGSSDVHFESFEQNGRVRFRIDGKLIERYLIPSQEYPILINRIKIMAQLDISEKRLPQDGRIQSDSGGEAFDIRVSAMPTLHGEKMVLRILKKDNRTLDLKHLGFTKDELNRYRAGIKKPHGMILISGPTGSGKTTTLYASLKELNKTETNILTIEDPIEYTLEGINQVSLRENIGLDFPNTLRTFLRQDPDIIMVGEIRDPETANMAIRAALTGHLVLSTIHTNSAWATVSRLLDMGIPPFLIANTLHMSVAQRLLRKLCPKCKEKAPLSKNLFPENFPIPDDVKSHYLPRGCADCFFTGYLGRIAVYEILPISKELTKFIKRGQLEIDDYLADRKINTLQKNALDMVKKGCTSVEEIHALLT